MTDAMSHHLKLTAITASYEVATKRMELAWARYRQARHDGSDERRYMLRFVRSLRASGRIRASLAKHLQEGTL